MQAAPLRPTPVRPSMQNRPSNSKRPTKRKNLKSYPSMSNPSSVPIISQETMYGLYWNYYEFHAIYADSKTWRTNKWAL
ncbi:uncharacterized protein DS421_17g599590 [Arachis hypogaea]|nr:uncharacterized protein DS421_17g599590 [Arachis hypogaea]